MNARLLLLIAAFTLPAPVWASELYRVEIIVFVQPDAQAQAADLYAPIVPIDTSDSVDFGRYSCQPLGFTKNQHIIFSTEEDVAACLSGYLRLNELSEPMIAERLNLEEDAGYQVLHHIAWQQPAQDPKNSRAVRLSNATLTADNQSGLLDGLITLSHEQFLQLDIEMNYLPEAPSIEEAGAEEAGFPQGMALRTLRKLRSGQLNYMDHPYLGILARVTEIEEPPEEEDNGEAEGR